MTVLLLFCLVLLPIQLSQGTEATPIFMPEDGYNWQIAKACFEASEFM